MTEMTISKAFGELTEPRINRNLRHPLVNIITISICAISCGCDNFYSIEQYGNSKIEWFKEFLDLKHGIPSHDTFSDVLNRLYPLPFKVRVLIPENCHCSNCRVTRQSQVIRLAHFNPRLQQS